MDSSYWRMFVKFMVFWRACGFAKGIVHCSVRHVSMWPSQRAGMVSLRIRFIPLIRLIVHVVNSIRARSNCQFQACQLQDLYVVGVQAQTYHNESVKFFLSMSCRLPFHHPTIILTHNNLTVCHFSIWMNFLAI